LWIAQLKKNCRVAPLPQASAVSPRRDGSTSRTIPRASRQFSSSPATVDIQKTPITNATSTSHQQYLLGLWGFLFEYKVQNCEQRAWEKYYEPEWEWVVNGIQWDDLMAWMSCKHTKRLQGKEQCSQIGRTCSIPEVQFEELWASEQKRQGTPTLFRSVYMTNTNKKRWLRTLIIYKMIYI
jgi:hypothetical protein